MERGSEKQVSEDTILVGQEILKEGYYEMECVPSIIAVADGVGGNAGGREASEFIMSKIKEMEYDDLHRTASLLNEELLAYARTVPGKENMATTFSGLFFESNPYKILHVGNTRVFAIQGVYLKQLTTDHTTVEWLRMRGQYDAADNAPSNEITACFGSGNSSRLTQHKVVEIDRSYAGYVLTTDGIHDYVDIEELEAFLSEGDFSKEAFSELIQKAKDNGSLDDKSIVLISNKERI